MSDPHWTWEWLRDFFAGKGEIRAPAGEELIADCRDPFHLSGRLERPKFKWFAGIVGDPDGARPLSDAEIAAMNELEEGEERLRRFIRERMINGVPMEMGLDLANGRSETWLMWWDAEEGKMVYRKIDPADMARDQEGRGKE